MDGKFQEVVDLDLESSSKTRLANKQRGVYILRQQSLSTNILRGNKESDFSSIKRRGKKTQHPHLDWSSRWGEFKLCEVAVILYV